MIEAAIAFFIYTLSAGLWLLLIVAGLIALGAIAFFFFVIYFDIHNGDNDI